MRPGAISAIGLLLVSLAFLPAVATAADEVVSGLRNPSARILVDRDWTLPTSGTVGFGMSVFRVANGAELSLAALDARLRAALRGGFAGKGLAYQEESPDFLVSYALAAGAEIDEAELNREYGDLLTLPTAEAKDSAGLHYERGVLIVDLVDRRARRLLWRGAILAELDMNWPEARKQERCDAAVGHLMRLFPHPPVATPDPP
jgi:hypothetical protein